MILWFGCPSCDIYCQHEIFAEFAVCSECGSKWMPKKEAMERIKQRELEQIRDIIRQAGVPDRVKKMKPKDIKKELEK